MGEPKPIPPSGDSENVSGHCCGAGCRGAIRPLPTVGEGAPMSDEAVDFDYLEGFAAGDMQVVTEVLALFQGQAEGWIPRIERADPADWRDLAHTIKGSARGIGAAAL